MSNRTVPATAEGLPSLSTGQTLPPYQGDGHAFSYIEDPISRALKFARLLKFVAEVHDDRVTDEWKAEAVSAMSFLAGETFRAVDELETVWLHFHNARADQSLSKLAQEAGR